MKIFSVRSLVMVVGLAVLACGVQVGVAGAQGTMPPGSYECKPLSEENFLEPPPIGGSSSEMTPEEKAAADASKLPADLCPPGMIAYPVPIAGDIAHPGTPDSESADTHPGKAEKAKAKAKAKKAKAKAKAKKARKRCLAKAKTKKAKKRCLAKANAASRR